MRVNTPPTHAINYGEQIYCFEICSTDFGYNLVCIAGDKKLTLGRLHFPEESESNDFNWEHLKDIYNHSRCHALCFGPETSLVVVPKSVIFCSAGADFQLRVYRTDLQDSVTVQTLEGHSNYINGVAWDAEGDYLASVSDDYSCKIWSAESQFKVVTTFCLSSAGMSIKWHPEEPHKVLVAEKKGVIHLYNVRTQQAVISVEAPKSPLIAADWALNNRLCVTALAGGDIITWDLRRPCAPLDVKQVHEDGGRAICFAPHNELVVASIGRPDITLKVFTSKSIIPMIEAPLKLFGGMAWHHRLPYIAAACDRKLFFWQVQLK